MDSRPVRYLILGQVSLVFLLLVCYWLDPELVDPNRGFSNYGVLPHTRLIYAVAFALCGYFVAMAAQIMPTTPKDVKWLRQMLWILVFWILAIWLTTYVIFTTIGWLHKLSVVLAFVFEFVLAGEIALLWKRNWLTISLLGVETLGLAIAITSNFHVIHMLFIGQLLTQIAFAPLVTLTAWDLTNKPVTESGELTGKQAKVV